MNRRNMTPLTVSSASSRPPAPGTRMRASRISRFLQDGRWDAAAGEEVVDVYFTQSPSRFPVYFIVIVIGWPARTMFITICPVKLSAV